MRKSDTASKMLDMSERRKTPIVMRLYAERSLRADLLSLWSWIKDSSCERRLSFSSVVSVKDSETLRGSSSTSLGEDIVNSYIACQSFYRIKSIRTSKYLGV